MICKNQGPYRLNFGEMWDKPLKKLEKVDNPTETDETEDEKTELSFWTMQITDFLYLLSINHFTYSQSIRHNKDLGIRAHLELEPILDLEPPSKLAITITALALTPSKYGI